MIIKIIKESACKMLNEDYDPLLEMARVGFINGEYEIFVYTDDEGHVPHIHIRDNATKGHQFETCVELKNNRYFFHGECKDTMSIDMINAFAEFMESIPRNTNCQNNYELSVVIWNLNNSTYEVIPQYDSGGRIIMPNYRTIEKRPK